MYRLVGFHGTAATMLKFFLLAIVDAVAGLAIASSIGAGSTIMAIVLTVILVFLNWVYIFRTPTPIKFLAPGIIFLLTFVVVPIVYTIAMAGFNFKTGNELSKDDSLSSLLAMESEVLDEAGNAISYEYVLGHPEGSDEWGILTWSRPDGITISDVVLVTTESQTPVAEGDYVPDDFGMTIVSAKGFTMATENEIAKLGDGLLALKFPMGEGNVLVPVDLMYANVVSIDYQYDSAEDTLTNVKTGVVYKDNGKGNFANVEDASDLIYPGWRAPNFPENFTGLLFDEELRNPFIRVFIWTVAFAFLSVFTTFVVGLTLAMALDKPMRGRRIYRSILILPYAIPGFLSILIWRGMFNKDFGIINRLLTEVGLINSNIGWFDEPWTARFVILFVNLWLGFPYMYLISSGALQAIPSDLKEAAAIDGATPWQAFRAVVLPLLLQILNPLLISSFAFNFNNFNIIYLLNAGGPKDELAGERAGATDILISYAYQTAVSDPGNQNFGLASAISLFMFIIVGVLSMWSLRQSKALEEF